MHRFALGTSVERVFAEIAGAVELGLYVYQVDDSTDCGSLRLVYANPASVEATGVALTEIIGCPIREAFPGLMATDLPATYLEIALGGPARALGEVTYGDSRVAEQVFSVEAFPLPDKTVGISFKNLTSQRLVEREAVQALESMSDAFLTLDPSWNITYLNPQNETILGQPREALIGKNIWELFPEARETCGLHELHRALHEQTEISVEDYYPHLGRTLAIRAYPITGGLAVYYTDVTRQREIESQLDRAQRLEAVGRVTASVAHDFNNLLTVIRSCAYLGKADAEDPEEAAAYFGEIDSAAEKAVALTRQLLSFSRRHELTPASVDLNEVVSEFATLLGHLMTPDISLSLDLSDSPVPAYVERAQIEQVILNLVVNARDATSVGTVTIRTSTKPPEGLIHDVTDDSGWLQVIDTGCGIEPEVIGQIFEPFFSTKSAETGTGLGLATLYGIVVQSRGNVFVESNVGEGTTFTVVLPATEQSAQTPAFGVNPDLVAMQVSDRGTERAPDSTETFRGEVTGPGSGAQTPIVYCIDADDRIVSMNDEAGFAEANGAPQLVEQVVGRSLWDFITGEDLTALWRDVLARVRTGVSVTLPYRCDAPGERRRLSMRLSPVAKGGIEFVSTLTSAEQRDPVSLLAARSGVGVSIRSCSWCRRFDAGGFVEVEEAIARLGLLQEAPQPITHTICSDCSTAVHGALDRAEKAAA